MPLLKVARGRSSAEEFRFDAEVVIGRADDADVRVYDEAASRRHAALRPEGDDWVACDLGSLNGLYVNGRRVERHVLRTGDELTVRNLTLVFVADGAGDRPTVIEDRSLEIESTIEPESGGVRGPDEERLPRLAAVYSFHEILAGPMSKLRADLVAGLEEIFAPARAALILPDANRGTFSRSVVEHVKRKREGVLVREPRLDLPKATSLVTEKVLSAIAAPLGAYGAFYVDRVRGEPFTRDDLALLTALANATTPVLRPQKAAPALPQTAQDLLGESPPMRTLRGEIARVAPTDATVLVTGDTGTGKELVAAALHAGSRRARGPFIAVNCAAFVETLLEAELFGHEKGAFTGADKSRAGRFEQAHGGTLFLDEVGELAAGMQAKLLRVLETREFHRLGATKPTRVDVRIVAATNRDLHDRGFREDLFYRLSVVTLRCPPLRDRTDDVELLARHFLPDHEFAPDALAKLKAYKWPGNVRELKNVCERCAVFATQASIAVRELPLEVRLGSSNTTTKQTDGDVRTLKEMEKVMVARALEATGGNRTKAAKLLGITYPTLKKKIDEYGI